MLETMHVDLWNILGFVSKVMERCYQNCTEGQSLFLPKTVLFRAVF